VLAAACALLLLGSLGHNAWRVARPLRAAAGAPQWFEPQWFGLTGADGRGSTTIYRLGEPDPEPIDQPTR